jgi:hypothetical protein
MQDVIWHGCTAISGIRRRFQAAAAAAAAVTAAAAGHVSPCLERHRGAHGCIWHLVWHAGETNNHNRLTLCQRVVNNEVALVCIGQGGVYISDPHAH